MLRDKRTIALFVIPVLVVYVVTIPIPLISSLLLSLSDWNLLSPPRFIGLRNFIGVFTTDYIFLRAIRNTVVYTGLSILLQLPMAFLLANLLHHPLRGRNMYRNIIFLPITFSGAAVSLMWYFFYHPGVGLVNQVVRVFAGSSFAYAWLAKQETALAAVVLSVAWQWVGYHMVIFLAGLAAIPVELFESARMDGASGFQIVRRIVLPLMVPVISVSLVLITTSSLKSFDSIYLMTGGGPNHATEVLASHMYVKAFAQLRYGYGSAIGFILFALSVCATIMIRHGFARLESER